MGYVQLSDDLKSLIEQQVAEGHAASEADFVAEAVRLYAGYLATEHDIAAMVERADGDMAAGRYVTVSTSAERQRLVCLTDIRLSRYEARGPVVGREARARYVLVRLGWEDMTAIVNG